MNYTLSPRQYEVASLLAQDIGYKEIARRLGISPQTVKVTLSRVEERLGVQSYVGIVIIMLTKSVKAEDQRKKEHLPCEEHMYAHPARSL